MTNTLLWTAFAVFIALVLAAVVVRGFKRLARRGTPPPHHRPGREDDK